MSDISDLDLPDSIKSLLFAQKEAHENLMKTLAEEVRTAVAKTQTELLEAYDRQVDKLHKKRKERDDDSFVSLPLLIKDGFHYCINNSDEPPCASKATLGDIVNLRKDFYGDNNNYFSDGVPKQKLIQLMLNYFDPRDRKKSLFNFCVSLNSKHVSSLL